MQIIGGQIKGGRIKDYSPVTMRSLLSASGQTAYDSTTVGNWFNVSAADYASVFSGLTSVTKYGLTDVQLGSANNAWSSGYAQAFGAGLNAQLAAGTYVIGFASRTYTNALGYFTPLISNALPTSGTYSSLANSVGNNSNNVLAYYLRRAPSAVATTSYLGIVGNVNMYSTTSVTGITNWYSNTGSPNFTSWVAYNANPLIFQALGTPTLQW